MAADEQKRLADQYRHRQQALSSTAVRDLLRLVEALFDLSGPGLAWTALRLAIRSLIRDRRQQSADLAAAYYVAMRQDAGASSPFTPPTPRVLSDDGLDRSLDSVGLDVFDRAVRAGASPEQARDRMAVTLGGRASYLVLEGGRQVMEGSSSDDPVALGWIRVTDADPCSWCSMLASRGAVYKSAETAGKGKRKGQVREFRGAGEFKYHDYDNCVVSGTLVDGPPAEIGYRRKYQGEIVVILTALGNELRITPNHPVLTNSGWVPAGLLSKGDKVVSSFNAQGSLLSIPDEQHVPAAVEDVWRALSMRGLVGMPGAPEDFHGDGADGEVHVVGADSLLWDYLRVVDETGELSLSLGGVTKSRLANRSLARPLRKRHVTAAYHLMGRLGLGAPLLGRESGCGHDGGGGGIANGHSCLVEALCDDSASDSIALCDGRHAHSRPVGGHHFVKGDVLAIGAGHYPALSQFPTQRGGGNPGLSADLFAGFTRQVQVDGLVQGIRVGGRMARFDPPGAYGSVNGRDAYSRLGRNLLKRLPGQVERDRVVDVRRIDFSGHVFNFQTEAGWYRADGVVVSNCHAIPIFHEDSPYQQRAEELYDQWKQVTVGESGAGARNAWRRYWEGRSKAEEESG